ncbi:MAG: hypothetical protein LW688_09390 [Cryomorphaceae bacterium]|jgi:hypothetical protein|nr:hypothetical protein [Cryomorphaceae bacterium]
MKLIYSLLFTLTTSFLGFSQTNFEILNTGKKYSSEQLAEAFKTANLCGSYYTQKRNVLTFDDGAQVALKSSEELKKDGVELQAECVLPEGSAYYEAIWSIGENGRLLKGFQTEKHSSVKEYQHLHDIHEKY